MNQEVGNILKTGRIATGLSVSEVAKETKIREYFITAIEENDKKSVPDSYYELFIRKYAAFLKIELPEDEEKKNHSDHILEMLTENNGGKKKNNLCRTVTKKFLLFFYLHKKSFLSLIAILLFAMFIKHIYNILNTGEKSEKSESMVKIITIEGDPGDKISVDIRDSIMFEDSKQEFFHISISAVDCCYVCYFRDSLNVEETILLPGKHLDLKAEKIIEAKLGKSNAVNFEFNQASTLEELIDLKNMSSFVRFTSKGAERIKKSDKINEYLKNFYGLE